MTNIYMYVRQKIYIFFPHIKMEMLDWFIKAQHLSFYSLRYSLTQSSFRRGGYFPRTFKGQGMVVKKLMRKMSGCFPFCINVAVGETFFFLQNKSNIDHD